MQAYVSPRDQLIDIVKRYLTTRRVAVSTYPNPSYRLKYNESRLDLDSKLKQLESVVFYLPSNITDSSWLLRSVSGMNVMGFRVKLTHETSNQVSRWRVQLTRLFNPLDTVMTLLTDMEYDPRQTEYMLTSDGLITRLPTNYPMTLVTKAPEDGFSYIEPRDVELRAPKEIKHVIDQTETWLHRFNLTHSEICYIGTNTDERCHVLYWTMKRKTTNRLKRLLNRVRKLV